MAALIIDKVEDGRVGRGSVVEDDDSVLSPLDPGLTVLGIGEMLEEELEQSVAFFLLEADDLLGV